MNKQEFIEKLREHGAWCTECHDIHGEKDRYVKVAKVRELIEQLDEPQVEKVEVPEFVAEWFEIHKDELEYHVWRLIIKSNEDYADYESDKTDMRYWIQYAPYHPIETLIRMKDGYTVKPKRWVVKSKDHIGLESFVSNTIIPVWTTEEPLWMTFTDKSKAEAVATLVDGSVEEV